MGTWWEPAAALTCTLSFTASDVLQKPCDMFVQPVARTGGVAIDWWGFATDKTGTYSGKYETARNFVNGDRSFGGSIVLVASDALSAIPAAQLGKRTAQGTFKLFERVLGKIGNTPKVAGAPKIAAVPPSVVAPATGPLPAAQAGGASKDVALGLTHHGTAPRPSTLYPNPREALEVFGRNRDAANWHYWRREGLTPTTDARFGFEAAFNEATANARNVHFNLDGYNLRLGRQRGQGTFDQVPFVTDWEFVRVLRDPALRQKTVFWQNGQQVPLSRVLERAGIPPNAIP